MDVSGNLHRHVYALHFSVNVYIFIYEARFFAETAYMHVKDAQRQISKTRGKDTKEIHTCMYACIY